MQDDEHYPRPPDPLAGRESEFGELPPREQTELPPVEPPSAGFIVQLFLVPALIVTVVIGVYLLFGQLASGEQDWRRQLTDVRSDNPHVRWRGALGLAQMLQADVNADGMRLAENRDVAAELSGMLQDSLDRASTREDDYKQREFLTRTLGMLDVPDVTFPVLISAMDPARDREVRKNAIASLAATADRMGTQQQPMDASAVVPEIIAATDESDAMIRHLATFALGLFETTAAEERLEVLLNHGDELTCVNAAVALARHGSTAGVPTFEEILQTGGDAGDHAASISSPNDASDAEAIRFERTLKLTNTLKALNELSGQLDARTRARIAESLAPIAETNPDSRVRIEAQTLLTKLEALP